MKFQKGDEIRLSNWTECYLKVKYSANGNIYGSIYSVKTGMVHVELHVAPESLPWMKVQSLRELLAYL